MENLSKLINFDGVRLSPFGTPASTGPIVPATNDDTVIAS
jgi:hypothetical protein